MSSAGTGIWAIGDIQGCHQALKRLLERLEQENGASQYWFAGDLVNRGPDSAGALRRIMALGERATCVLGNHDLHLLAVAAGARSFGKSDTIQDVLQAPDADRLLDWLRHRPLLVRRHGHVMIHAGILPDWSLDQAESLAREIEEALRGPHWRQAMHDMYGKGPTSWNQQLQGAERMRVIVNIMTRMRLCRRHKERVEFSSKGKPDAAKGWQPWFDLPAQRDSDTPVIFGHWSALGLHIGKNAICLDSGCVWGRALTALHLGDRRIIQQDCSGCR